MSVRKYIRYAAPYRSKTFNDKDRLLVGRNGVLAGGDVSTSGSVVTVSPVTMIQGGQIIDIDTPLSAALPNDLVAPYFLALSVSSPVENLGETISPTFVKRPSDINEQVVLLAEWDGTEWRKLPRLQIGEQVRATQISNQQRLLKGVASGFEVTKSDTHLFVAPGAAILADGSEVCKKVETALKRVAAPVNRGAAFNRIDTVVFRRPLGDEPRVSQLRNIVGPSYVSGVSTRAEDLLLTDPASSVSKVKILNHVSGKIAAARIVDGNILFLTTFDDELETVVSDAAIAGLVADYDIAVNPSGDLEIVYTRTDDKLYYQRRTIDGGVLNPETTLYSSTAELHFPAVVSAGKSGNHQTHVAVCRSAAGTEKEIGYIRLGSSGQVITPFAKWIDLNADLRAPSFAKDDEDMLVFMSFHNNDTGRAYLYTFDAASATASAPLTHAAPVVELQNETYNPSMQALMPAVGASATRVFRTQNKETFALWLQEMSNGSKLVAVYNPRYKQLFGYKAMVLSNTPVTAFGADLDEMNRVYLSMVRTDGLGLTKRSMSLETLESIAPDYIQEIEDVVSAAVIFAPRGDLLHVFTLDKGVRYLRTTAGVESTLREQLVCPSDIYLAYIRLLDGKLSVSDTMVGEQLVIKRLYEQFNCFGASGTVSWGGTITNTLSTSAISIHFLNRVSTYTMPSGTWMIPSGHLIAVTIPDEDENATLTPEIIKFGEGLLDRMGKRVMPLFWNFNGRLYSNFSPFSFDPGGETGELGGTVSTELLNWIGANDSAPHASNHGYGSTHFILEGDSLVTAIGKLDQAVAGRKASITSGKVAVDVGATSITVLFPSPRTSASYALVCSLTNVEDEDPIFQPVCVNNRTPTSFTASWSIPADTENYEIEFILRDASQEAGRFPITWDATSASVIFPAPQEDTQYSLVCGITNEVDADPVLQPIAVTSRTTTGFTAKWSCEFGSDNYILEYMIHRPQ